jgi:hypothetical protein
MHIRHNWEFPNAYIVIRRDPNIRQIRLKSESFVDPVNIFFDCNKSFLFEFILFRKYLSESAIKDFTELSFEDVNLILLKVFLAWPSESSFVGHMFFRSLLTGSTKQK